MQGQASVEDLPTPIEIPISWENSFTLSLSPPGPCLDLWNLSVESRVGGGAWRPQHPEPGDLGGRGSSWTGWFSSPCRHGPHGHSVALRAPILLCVLGDAPCFSCVPKNGPGLSSSHS